MTFWRKNGHIVGRNGVPIRCSHCPCGGCSDVEVLRQRAVANGWTWHGEGVMTSLVRNGVHTGSWYDITAIQPVWICAWDTANNRLYYVPCGCDDDHSEGYWINWYDLTGLSATFYLWIEYAGACSCVDKRELLLTYPDLFGVEGISWGNNSVYSYTDSDYGTGTGWCGNTSYLDYRAMCVIMDTLTSSGSVKMQVMWKYPTESSWRYGPVRDSIEWVRHREPFTEDPWFGWWDGTSISWNADQFQRTTHSWPTKAEADDDLAQATPNPYPGYGCSYPVSNLLLTINTPETTPELHQGRVYQSGNHWVCEYPWYSMGRPTTYRGTTVYFTYRVQYLQTNKGILVNGEQGWTDSLTIYGLRGTYGASDWGGTACWDHTAPLTDTVVTPTAKDEDMHWCHSGFTVPTEEDY